MIDRLHAALGRPPDVVWRAPGRVNLIGEHTDYNDGFMLPFAIDRSTVAAAARRSDGELRFTSLGRRAGDRSWLAYPEGVAKALADEGIEIPGADVAIDSDVAIGAGLSSSAALEVAVALTLLDLATVELERVRVALLCRRAEQEAVGVPVGVMDQLVSVLGRAGHALLIDARSLDTEEIPVLLEETNVIVLVIDTTVAHALRSSGYADRRRECESAARALGVGSLRDVRADDVEGSAALDDQLKRRARHVVTENDRVLRVAELLRAGRIADAGPLVTASHESLRDDYEVSTPELDTAVACALGAGALGARMVGGGFGGAAIALCRADVEKPVVDAVAAAFRERGCAEPRFFRVTPSEGASRLA